ncbi:hypothetical protein, partial [Jatrophihabitans sp.]|uniref:hypothetical protein n=1 Tax=Jatrophihabitans sp. TaxID=1932789 RepID=UPI0030C6AC05
MAARWSAPRSSAAGHIIHARVTLLASQALHGVELRLTSSGPVAHVTGATATPTLGRNGRVVPVTLQVIGAGLGTVTAQVTGRDPAGKLIRGSDELDLDTAGKTVVLSTSGRLQAQEQVLALERPRLDKSAYAAALGALTGGSRITPATPGTATVSGQVEYLDSAGNPHPARDIGIEIRAAGAAAGDPPLTCATTDGSGVFKAPVTTAIGTSIFVRALAESVVPATNATPCAFETATAGATGFVVHAPGVATAQHKDSAPLTVSGASVAFPILVASNTAPDTAFDVADALVTAEQFTMAALGYDFP